MECKYHVVFIPKYRRKTLFKELRKDLGSVFRELARRKQCEILEGAPDIRSCTHDDIDSPEVCSCAGNRILIDCSLSEKYIESKDI